MYLIQLPGFESNYRPATVGRLVGNLHRKNQTEFTVCGYKKYFPLRSSMNRRAKHTGQAVTSDCDPFNLYCSTATDRIKRLVQDPRFVISLRDPVERAYSDYWMHASRGFESRSFEECIDDELSGREERFRKRFLHQSVYAPHLVRWFDTFGRERFFVIKAEDFFHDPQQVASAMFVFLGLTSITVDITARNRSKNKPPLQAATRERLRQYFREPSERLRDLLGADFLWH